jgi:excisionase family DNA binding protein
MKAMFRVREAAEILGISVPKMRNDIRNQRVGVHRLGRLILISEADLEKYVNQGYHPAIPSEVRKNEI